MICGKLKFIFVRCALLLMRGQSLNKCTLSIGASLDVHEICTFPVIIDNEHNLISQELVTYNVIDLSSQNPHNFQFISNYPKGLGPMCIQGPLLGTTNICIYINVAKMIYNSLCARSILLPQLYQAWDESILLSWWERHTVKKSLLSPGSYHKGHLVDAQIKISFQTLNGIWCIKYGEIVLDISQKGLYICYTFCDNFLT